MSDATCRGSYILGSACGRCKRCEQERKAITNAATTARHLAELMEAVGGDDKRNRFPWTLDIQVGGKCAIMDAGWKIVCDGYKDRKMRMIVDVMNTLARIEKEQR